MQNYLCLSIAKTLQLDQIAYISCGLCRKVGGKEGYLLKQEDNQSTNTRKPRMNNVVVAARCDIFSIMKSYLIIYREF